MMFLFKLGNFQVEMKDSKKSRVCKIDMFKKRGWEQNAPQIFVWTRSSQSIQQYYLAILCDLFGMVKWPFSMAKWPPTSGWKGHFESPGSCFFRMLLVFGMGKSAKKPGSKPWRTNWKGHQNTPRPDTRLDIPEISQNNLSHEKNPYYFPFYCRCMNALIIVPKTLSLFFSRHGYVVPFHFTGWLIGILIMVY